MRCLFLFSIFLYSTGIYSQNLTQGVSTEITLISDSLSSLNISNCSDMELSFYSNFFSFPSGMSLFLIIDSIASDSDSLLLNQGNLITNLIVNPPYTIPINASSENLLIDFFGTETFPKLYLRIIASGTPENEGEAYYCSHTKSILYFPDDCGTDHITYYGGNGPLDNNLDCVVGVSSSISMLSEKGNKIFPNPFYSTINIELNEVEYPAYYSIISLDGKEIFKGELNRYKTSLQLESLTNGSYFVVIDTTNGYRISKLLIKK